MDLLVIRHAIAEDATQGQSDAARELTSEGRRRFRRSVHGLRELDWSLDRVLTSPWARAMQTVDLLKPIIEGSVTSTELLCDKPRPELFALIAEQSAPQRDSHATAVVGHEPWLSELIAWLAFGDPHHSEGIELKKGGVAWLQGTATPGGMTLRALLTPKLLRALR
jgi:phosphohistidine phosphatase